MRKFQLERAASIAVLQMIAHQTYHGTVRPIHTQGQRGEVIIVTITRPKSEKVYVKQRENLEQGNADTFVRADEEEWLRGG